MSHLRARARAHKHCCVIIKKYFCITVLSSNNITVISITATRRPYNYYYYFIIIMKSLYNYHYYYYYMARRRPCAWPAYARASIISRSNPISHNHPPYTHTNDARAHARRTPACGRGGGRAVAEYGATSVFREYDLKQIAERRSANTPHGVACARPTASGGAPARPRTANYAGRHNSWQYDVH